jgi:hypothetical protein
MYFGINPAKSVRNVEKFLLDYISFAFKSPFGQSSKKMPSPETEHRFSSGTSRTLVTKLTELPRTHFSVKSVATYP